MIEIVQAECLQWMNGRPSDSVDLVIGSPPYAHKGLRYGDGDQPWPLEEWIPWMLSVTGEAVRLARNIVIWVVNGSVVKGNYRPAVEGLVYEAYKAGIVCERPAIWHKNAPPNRHDWLSNSWEFCVAFRPANSERYFDWESIAEPPKYTNGGRFRQRGPDGTRVMSNPYPQNKLTRPKDVLRVTVGGGHMGHKLAHENEAPFPEKLVEPFVLTCTKPGGTVLDPFGGSGTTASVADRLGRNAISLDIRESQCELTARRTGQTLELAG
jgi:site-specific DNA-methyltransferase (adenine-specific)